jgi:hypothetical protein
VSGAPEYFRIFEGEPLPDISAFGPFRAIVVIDATYSVEWQDQVSDWLVASGCLFMLAWGSDCSSWDDSVDYASLRAFDFGEIPGDHWVYTTWHEDQNLREVFNEAQFIADHDKVELRFSLIIHIGMENRRNEFLELWEAAREES